MGRRSIALECWACLYRTSSYPWVAQAPGPHRPQLSSNLQERVKGCPNMDLSDYTNGDFRLLMMHRPRQLRPRWFPAPAADEPSCPPAHPLPARPLSSHPRLDMTLTTRPSTPLQHDPTVERELVVGPAEPEAPFPVYLEGAVERGFGRGSKDLGCPTGKSPRAPSSAPAYFRSPGLAGEATAR